MKPSESKVNDIECTPLEGGDYKSCNANCYPGNFDCYYGTDAPLHCYCYTDSSTSGMLFNYILIWFMFLCKLILTPIYIYIYINYLYILETVEPIKSTENNAIDDIECTHYTHEFIIFIIFIIYHIYYTHGFIIFTFIIFTFITQKPLSSYSWKWRFLQQNMTEIKQTKLYTSPPDSNMVTIPTGIFNM